MKGFLPSIPSWSWLSIRPSSRVISSTNLKGLETYQSKLRLLDWHIKWEAAPFTSRLVSSRLFVSGLLKPLGMALPPPRGRKDPLELSFEAPWDEFLHLSIRLDQRLEHDQEREGLSVLHLFSDDVYHVVMLVTKKEGDSNDSHPRYRRLGAGSIHRPKGHPGFFSNATWERLMLI